MSEDKTITHKVFVCTVSFFEPNGGPIRIVAKDEAHAKELIPQILKHAKHIKILDIVAEDAIAHASGDDEAPPSASPPTSNMVN